ncbi:tRNA (adenosine(37)-N6)-threonylcarbamoyltransferase complex dimerization subunit type 1 TsaB [Weissella diestrammenae]|uniref:tRNA (Adenosine(37)-N6)-threonylcarbamoyltransferase complex dimerization subunit type 1 TsaB n=1 Tax=Weissella diestrammenae TaxID=1162633 RepID=A0A7G9T6U4_9LACO|nr:tRNA (adenosine(37)-N6)-threonylcarbamoyltransferase complex dimerization subunit type 1 TsaB [Weissella diestrammenae]MCM0582592.1 tRNA (adenosine(37)-N6)-threonylcarbamoyltransferase complex dimerization subunit type 1 TsaB [Weissella diestrammenae]QNN75819.1 tRNA (adenosine(37)-N6)-threonylcarbamoyltransferase complex dimerization subunit type 1 TsaB [Weissella diestrammenae]
MKTIAFDTSNQPMSVALFDADRLVGEIETNLAKNHSEQLLLSIDELVKSAGWQPSDLNRVITSQGPGSYTGLRIAVTTAKTLAFSLHLELIGLSGLALLAGNVIANDTIVIPLMDARNDNVYAGQYRWRDGKLVNVVADQHTSIYDLPMAVNSQERVIYVGDWEKYEAVIKAQVPQAEFSKDNVPHARHMLTLIADESVLRTNEAIHQFNPQYLRVTQAEAEWQAAHPNVGRQNYVEKVK